MPPAKKSINDTGSRLDALAMALRARKDEVEADPFDDAMLAATFGFVELAKTHSGMLEQIRKTGQQNGTEGKQGPT